MTPNLYSGVWLSDEPFDLIQLGGPGDRVALFAVDLNLSNEELVFYEWVEEGKGYREFLIPADIIKTRGETKLLSEGSPEWLGAYGITEDEWCIYYKPSNQTASITDAI